MKNLDLDAGDSTTFANLDNLCTINMYSFINKEDTNHDNKANRRKKARHLL